jgi:hypothetical protein
MAYQDVNSWTQHIPNDSCDSGNDDESVNPLGFPLKDCSSGHISALSPLTISGIIRESHQTEEASVVDS